MGKQKKTEMIDFYCLNCGNGYPIQKSIGHRREKNHRKKLYCPWCKVEVNHIMLLSPEDKEQFKIDFENKKYEEEAKESIELIKKEKVFK